MRTAGATPPEPVGFVLTLVHFPAGGARSQASPGCALKWRRTNETKNKEESDETSVDRGAVSRRSRREHDETSGGPLGLGLGPRRIRHRRADRCGAVAASYAYYYPAYRYYHYPAYRYGYGYPVYIYVF
jgi:hypothetical protein